jgi:hypothetical protein
MPKKKVFREGRLRKIENKRGNIQDKGITIKCESIIIIPKDNTVREREKQKTTRLDKKIENQKSVLLPCSGVQ